MARIVFGDSGIFSYTATIGPDAQPMSPFALVSVSIYSATPSEAQIVDDSNALAQAIQHITSWTSGRSSLEKLVTIAPISDPDTTSSADHEVYWAVVRYTLETGGQTIRDVEPFAIYRVEGVQSRVEVSNSDLFAVEGKLEHLLSSMTLTDKITLAERLVKQDLRAKGLEIQKLEQIDAKDLVRYKAIVLCCMDLSNQPNDEWMVKAEKYDEFYRTLRDNVPLGYDSDDDGLASPGEEEIQIKAGAGFIFR